MTISTVNGKLRRRTDSEVSFRARYNHAMPPTRVPHDDVRARIRRWLDNWREVSPLLEQERAERLARMTDEEAQELARNLLALWRPSELDDMGEELATQQHWFMVAARDAKRR